jgi:GWxTD domain-containing protein
MKKPFIVLSFILLFIEGCNLFSKISYQNISYIYNLNISKKTPEYLIFHHADSITSLYFKVNSLNLSYLKSVNSDNYYSHFKIKIEIYDNYQSKNIVDSFNRQYIDTNFAFQNKEMIYCINFPLKNNDYLLKAIFSDENNPSELITYLNIYKKTKFNRQNFLLINNENIPLFQNIIPKSQYFHLCSNDTVVKRLYVNCYFREFPIAGPPFSNPKEKAFVIKADSNYSIEMTNGISSLININKKGIYHFRKDTLSEEGITIFHYYDDFPEIKTPLQMLPPIRYITSKKEYNAIILSKDKKISIEAFWLQAAGNSEKAIELIKKYYNRVEEANSFFSSYQEGWKTDRGIIYIVYGPPGIVYKTNNTETWIYGEENNHLSTKFYFYKVINRFTDNDYNLNKSETNRESWYIAINLWRKN